MKSVTNPINLLTNQLLDTLDSARLLVIHTSGYDFEGKSYFVMSVGEFKNAENNDCGEVIDVASHWEFFDNLTILPGVMDIYKADEGSRFIVKYQGSDGVIYEEMSIEDIRSYWEDSPQYETSVFVKNSIIAFIKI